MGSQLFAALSTLNSFRPFWLLDSWFIVYDMEFNLTLTHTHAHTHTYIHIKTHTYTVCTGTNTKRKRPHTSRKHTVKDRTHAVTVLNKRSWRHSLAKNHKREEKGTEIGSYALLRNKSKEKHYELY